MGIKLGKLLIGGTAAYVAYKALGSAFGRSDDALATLEVGKGVPCPGGDAKCTIRPAGKNIETRAKYIAEQIWNSSLDPEIRQLAMETLNRKCDGQWCTPPREHLREVKTLAGAVMGDDRELWDKIEGHFAWFKENVAYRKDHAYVDQFASAKRTIRQGGEDCDGACIFLGALNLTSGFPVGMRIYQTKNSNDWDHIAGLVQVPPHSGEWHVLDGSVDKVREGGRVKAIYPGWGAPPQMIAKYIDFQVLPGGKVKKLGSRG